MNNHKEAFEMIINGVKITGSVNTREYSKKIHHIVEIKAEREKGRIEGYYEFPITDRDFFFDEIGKAKEHLRFIEDKLKTNGIRLQYELDEYYLQGCQYHLWIDEVTDEEERELREWMGELAEERD